MIFFPTHFLQRWLKPQNQLFLKKISLAYSKHLLPFDSLILTKSILKPLMQRSTLSSSNKQQKNKTRLKLAVAYNLHRSFLNVNFLTTFTQIASCRIINKGRVPNAVKASTLKKGQKQSCKINPLVKALVIASQHKGLRPSFVSLSFKTNIRLHADSSKRLNTFTSNTTKHGKSLPLVFKILDLFSSIQFYQQRKFRRQTFIQRYVPQVKNHLRAKDPILSARPCWSHYLSKDRLNHVSCSTFPRLTISNSTARWSKPSQLTPRFLQTCLYTHSENFFKLLPNVSLFTPKEQPTRLVKLMWPATVYNSTTLLLYPTEILPARIKPFSTYNRFQVGFSIPLFLNLENLYSLANIRTSLQASINRQLHLTSFVTTLTTKRFLLLLTLQNKLLLSRSSWANTTNTLASNHVLRTYSTKFSRFEKLNQNENNRLTSIRFKPGYARQWRSFRQEFVEFFSLKKRYQYRLTRYITRLTILQRKSRTLASSLSVSKALVLSKLTTDLVTANTFINTGLTFLNGGQVTNGNAHLLPNDFIQLTVFLKYYVIYKVQKNQLLQSRRTLGHLMWKFSKKWKKNKTTYPLWAKNFNTSFFDVPLALEVDYFSSSCYIINSTRFISSQHSYVLPLYNWKYIV